MRLFVAIEISPDIRARITDFILRTQPCLTNARWGRPEGLHITLKFLGNVADQRRNAIEEALGRIASRQFDVSLQNIGVFPNARSPRVLWVGIQSGPELANLATIVDGVLVQLGFEREKRAFTPHVTLARFKEGSRTQNVSSALPESNPSFGTMTATEFHLYESKLSPKGASYSKLASFALK
ncbi:MAG: RNA 2',3'-cyclic phosphodiesterase [Acidobacteria bacterium]|nr:MAG: RNA 2',3'-cyclic phosphodiesterase [Acidobacteriota bacterium]